MVFSDIVDKIIDVLGNLVYLIIGLAVLTFLYGLFGYIANSGDEKKRKESAQYITYGLIGLFVMVSVWGLVALLSGILGEPVSVPQISF